MATIKEDYVSFEIAKLLKEKGFPQKQENSGYYATEMVYCTTESKDGTHHFCHQYPACCDKNYEYICAPTLQMAMKWLREEKNIFIVIEPHAYDYINEKNSSYVYSLWQGDNYYENPELKSYPSYEEAVEAALKYVLKNLI